MTEAIVAIDAIVPEKTTYGKDSDPGPGLGPEQWPEGSPQHLIYVFMEGSVWNRMVILATVWALFVPDTRTVTLNSPEYDTYIALGTLASLCVFIFELLANFYVGRDYGGLKGWDKITCECPPPLHPPHPHPLQPYEPHMDPTSRVGP